MRAGWATLALTMAACTGGRSAPADPLPAPSETGIVPAPETDTAIPAVPLGFVVDPAVSANDLGAGLTAWLDVQTTEPSTLTVVVTDPQRTRSWSVDTPNDAHHHLLLGLAADADHEIVVTAEAGGRTITSDPLSWHSEPLPDLTPIFRTAGSPSNAEPGVTMLHLGEHLWMVDARGQVVWFRDASPFTHQVELTPEGTLLWQVAKSHVEEVALSGEVLRSYGSSRADVEPGVFAVDEPALHHDAVELPGGNVLALGIEDRVYPDYPASEDLPEVLDPQARVAGDVVLELDAAGGVVGRWSMLDLLDPYRIGYSGLLGDYWDAFYLYDHTNDWAHGNSVWYDPGRDQVVVSLRHQDAVVAFAYPTGELAWIFAPEANWPPELSPYVLSPELPTDLPAYHQHSASITPAGNLLLFDNGNNRASAFEPRVEEADNYSRCLEVALDPAAGTWTTAWSWGEELVLSHYSPSLGDCDLLPITGNHLITFGRITNPALPGVKLIEVDSGGGEVWELVVESAIPDHRPELFRAQRLTGVIPGR